MLFYGMSLHTDKVNKNSHLTLQEIVGEEAMELNGWKAPDYDHIQLTKDMKIQLGALQGGAIEQASLYLDATSAADWCALASQEKYMSTFDNLPVDWGDWVAQLVSNHLKETDLDLDKVDVLGLGAGDGKKETILSRALYQKMPLQKLRCSLMDLSPSLAIQAHTHFTQSFRGKKNTECRFLLGDMHSLPFYNELFYDPVDAKTLKILCMFGGTFGNLRHEIHFIQNTLRACKSGDLLLLDVSLGFAPANQPEQIYKEDPRLSNYGTGPLEEWMEGTIRRNRDNVKTVRFENSLKTGVSTVPNTYTIEIQAVVDEEARFSVLQLHRYNPDDFVRTFLNQGWKALDGRYFSYKKKQLLYMFAKR